ncbi:MAG TPA: amino acid ABC transporter permease [Alphaproteobacteria bacterium]|nr:amino acid ABC transporter permease [Alphaproteobacteria bacterium]
MSAFFGTSSLSQSVTILLIGAGTTLAVSLAGNALGLLIAVPVCFLRLSPARAARAVGIAYVSFFRGVPLLVQLLIVYYFLPALGLDLPPFVAAAIGLGVCTAAYQAENLRGGFLIIPKGQDDAARAFGYTRLQTRRYILIPQALRAAAPTLINEMILILKASSLVSVVGVADLMRVSQNIVARDLRPIRWYMAAAVIYLVINLALALLGRAAERRLSAGYARGTL